MKDSTITKGLISPTVRKEHSPARLTSSFLTHLTLRREARSALFAGKYDIESGDWVDDTEDWEHYWNVLRDETNLYTYYEKYLLDYSDNQPVKAGGAMTAGGFPSPCPGQDCINI